MMPLVMTNGERCSKNNSLIAENKQALKFTTAQINYLIVLCRLDGGEKGIRCVDIAKELGVSKPSVYTMIKTFSDMKLVKKIKYGTVFMMENGKTIAKQYNSFYETVRNYFEQYLVLSHEGAQNAALSVLSSLSMHDIKSMCRQMRKYNM